MIAGDQERRKRQLALRSVPFHIKVVATGLFVGYIPWASGTFGSLLGLLLYWFIPGFEAPLYLGAAILLGFFAGVLSSRRVAESTGHLLTRTATIAKATFQPGDRGEADPSVVVIDEIVGMWISLLFLPKTVLNVIIAFCLFRVFDIIKPYPTRQMERIPFGWGIMLDDVGAGIYSNVATQICVLALSWILPGKA